MGVKKHIEVNCTPNTAYSRRLSFFKNYVAKKGKSPEAKGWLNNAVEWGSCSLASGMYCAALYCTAEGIDCLLE
jgi:hypothetical protein